METSSNIEIAEEMMSVAKVTRFTFAALIFVYQAAPAEKRKAESMEKEAFIDWWKPTRLLPRSKTMTA